MTVDAASATRVLDRSFTAFDTAKQGDPAQADGRVSQDDLQAVADNRDGRFSKDEVDAATFLLESRAARSFLDVAGRGPDDVDGTIGRGDVDAALVTIAGGGLDQALLDTAAGRGRADGHIGNDDLVAALRDPGVPQDLKDSLARLPEDLPLQTQLGAVFALRNNADDPEATAQLETLLGAPAFKGLDEAQQRQALALFGGTNAVSEQARGKLGDIDLADPASLGKFLLTEAKPADLWRDAAPASGVPDSQRKPYTVDGPEAIEHEFPSGTQPDATDKLPAWKYTVQVDGQSIEVLVPKDEALRTDKSYPTIEQIAKGLAAQPSASLEATDRVVVNPSTPKEKDDKGNVVDSGADMYAGGNTIGINPHGLDSPRAQRDFDFTFLHETAHLVEQPPQIFGQSMAWNAAVQQDRLFSTHYADDRYVDDGGSTIDPSLGVDPGEDFAEAYMIYHLVKGTPDEVQMRALMPARFAILDKMFP